MPTPSGRLTRAERRAAFPEPSRERLLARLERDTLRLPFVECWLWAGFIDRYGYGRFDAAGRWYRTSRLSYELFVGPIPDGLYVCHHCDWTACHRPDHLFAGDQFDNMRDAAAKGRTALGPRNGMWGKGFLGEQNPSAKLDEVRVREIRALVSAAVPYREIANRFGVSQATIGLIKTGGVWAHVP